MSFFGKILEKLGIKVAAQGRAAEDREQRPQYSGRVARLARNSFTDHVDEFGAPRAPRQPANTTGARVEAERSAVT